MAHWTYSDSAETADLEQGDFLVPTAELKAILRDVHPHFCDEKYLGFAVTTQTCDLVRRNGAAPNARYVGIASVRSLKQVLPELLAQLVDPIAPGIFGNSSKRTAQEFLGRLFNQNEHARGLFYFHPDEALGISEAAIAYLRVAVSLRVQHYDVLRSARRAQLGQEFQAKFGWLVGNLYSRVACRDWAADPAGKKILAGLIASNIEEQIAGLGPIWVDEAPARKAMAAGIGLDSLSREDLRWTLDAHRAASKISQVVDVVVREISRVSPTDDEKLNKLKNRLLNNGDLATLMK